MLWRHRGGVLLTLAFALIVMGTVWATRSEKRFRFKEAERVAAIPPPPPALLSWISAPLVAEFPKYKSDADNEIPWFCRGVWRDLLSEDYGAGEPEQLERAVRGLTELVSGAERCQGSIAWLKTKGQLNLRGRWQDVVRQQESMLEHCKGVPSAGVSGTAASVTPALRPDSPTCQAQVLFFRTAIYLAARSTPTDPPLAADTPMAALAHRFVLGLSALAGQPPRVEPIIETAQAILKLDDRVFEAAKALLIARLYEALERTHRPQGAAQWSDEQWARLLVDVERVRRISPRDPDVSRFEEMIQLRGGRPDLLKAYLEQHLERGSKGSANPQAVVLGEQYRLYEMLAYSEWRLGNRSRAERMLEEAMRLAPRERRLQTTLDRLRAPGASVEAFSWEESFFGVDLGAWAARLLRERPIEPKGVDRGA